MTRESAPPLIQPPYCDACHAAIAIARALGSPRTQHSRARPTWQLAAAFDGQDVDGHVVPEIAPETDGHVVVSYQGSQTRDGTLSRPPARPPAAAWPGLLQGRGYLDRKSLRMFFTTFYGKALEDVDVLSSKLDEWLNGAPQQPKKERPAARLGLGGAHS